MLMFWRNLVACFSRFHEVGIITQPRSFNLRTETYSYLRLKCCSISTMESTISTVPLSPLNDETISSPSTSEKVANQETSKDAAEKQQLPSTLASSAATPMDTPPHHNYSSATFRGCTYEIFKLELQNLPSHVGFKQVKNRLNSLKLNPVRIKIDQKRLCFVTFKSEEEKEEAMKVINGHVWKKKTLRAIRAKPAADPMMKRKRQAASSEAPEAKKICNEMDINERLAQAVTPLLKLPYEEQLSVKLKRMKDVLRKASQAILRNKPEEWFKHHVSINDGLLCPLDPIKPSPVLSEYRNKCEFTIGLGLHNNTVVGFRIGAYRDGDLTVAPPNSCLVPRKTMQMVEIVQHVVGELSSLKPFDCHTVDGHWKQVLVRHFTTGETMVVVQFHPQQLSQEIIDGEKQLLINAFTRSSNTPTSLYWQTFNDRLSGKERITNELLLGSEYIHEEILGVRFRVSPDAFFQINSKGTEVLYSTISELIAAETVNEIPTVYDLCCGTGTISITLSKNTKFSKVIGIELVEQAVTDAIYNAEANGLKNAEFICDKVENRLSNLFAKEGKNQSVIAIADPPRGGLHPKVIQAIRRCSNIETLIYVSCNPEGALNNFLDLCRPMSQRIKGMPFCPVRAVPIDMFPHTNHCELVIVFKRIQDMNAECDVHGKGNLVKSESGLKESSEL